MQKILNKYPFIIYIFTGALNTLISLTLYVILLHLKTNYLLASGIAYFFGIVEGYVFSALWVFKHNVRISGLLKFSSVFGFSFFLNLVAMYLIVDIISLIKLLAQIIVTGVLTILNYQLIKIFVFKGNGGRQKVSL